MVLQIKPSCCLRLSLALEQTLLTENSKIYSVGQFVTQRDAWNNTILLFLHDSNELLWLCYQELATLIPSPRETFEASLYSVEYCSLTTKSTSHIGFSFRLQCTCIEWMRKWLSYMDRCLFPVPSWFGPLPFSIPLWLLHTKGIMIPEFFDPWLFLKMGLSLEE